MEASWDHRDSQPVTGFCFCPFAGRTHQLRVHCCAIGHPIVGDFTYSFKKDSGPYRMMLHAYYLRIPTSKELIEVSAPDPFVPAVDHSWAPHRATECLEKLIQELKDTSVRALEGGPQGEFLVSPGPETPPEAKVPEAEEQRAEYAQWLAEWALE